ncbi:MAG: carbon-nitrogen hydrolase [Anaerolineales bacterium]|jgi:N-carbamoylputrescine amidase
MNRKVTLGLIQTTCTDQVEENFNKTLNHIKEAAEKGAQIVCTQELFKSVYFAQTEDSKHFKLAEEINENNPGMEILSGLAADLEIVLVAGLFEKRATGIYHNTAVVFDADGSHLGKYRKMHIPDDPLYYEKYYFTPGDLGYRVFRTRYADIGVLICWDQWFPEAARLLGLQGVEIILIPTAIGYSRPDETSSSDHAWRTVQQGHAVANVCYLAAVNRVGFEPDPSPPGMLRGVGPHGENGINFWGSSFIADPDGQILEQASKDEEQILVHTIDLDLIKEAKNRFSFPYRDRRIDSYQDLLKLYVDKFLKGRYVH